MLPVDMAKVKGKLTLFYELLLAFKTPYLLIKVGGSISPIGIG